ncbi:restriction endonuclease subunit S [Pontiella sp.]|uniref:restriction endonuclease subunit S n=1 Tax=Pontiella sp. TaxID=2837462 RepID=UPI003561C359
MKIDALAQIEVGQTFLSKQMSAEGGNIHLIEPRMMDAGSINYADTKRVQYSGKKILQRGDVLFVSRGKFEAAVFESDTPSVATNAFFVLRPNDQIKSGYLSAFLNSHQAQRHFRRKQKQTTAKFVSKEELLELDIPLVPPNEQEDLIHASDSLKQTEQLLLQKSQILKNIREGLFGQIQGVSL